MLLSINMIVYFTKYYTEGSSKNVMRNKINNNEVIII